jgi:hypothetical protein
MATTFQLPLPAAGQRSPSFPNRCVNCGEARETESRLLLKRLVMRGQRQVQVSWQADIPHCRRCARATKSVFLAGCIPFVLGFVLVGLTAFGVTTYGASAVGLDEIGDSETINSLVLGAAAGLIAGLFGGFVFELAARITLIPLFGLALLRAPLLAVQLVNDSDYVAGLTARLAPDGGGLRLTFANDSIAREFQALNPSAHSGL